MFIRCILYNPNLIIILVTHRVSALKLCDNIFHLSKDKMELIDINDTDLSIETLLKNIVYNN